MCDKSMRYIQMGRFYLNIQYYTNKKMILMSKTRKTYIKTSESFIYIIRKQ